MLNIYKKTNIFCTMSVSLLYVGSWKYRTKRAIYFTLLRNDKSLLSKNDDDDELSEVKG